MSLKTNAVVFGTFFINCIIIGLLVAAFVTEHWVVATAKRHDNTKSHGDLNFGLFQGSKQLNAGVGVRTENIDVRAIMRDEPSLLNYWLWLGTAVGGGLGAFASAVGAIAGVIKSAAPSKKKGTLVLLLVSHIAAALSTALAFICWLIHFLQQLIHNVLIEEDRNQKWFTKHVHLGHSFYFVVASFCLVLVNIILIGMVVHWERRDRRRRRHIAEPPVDEKTHGAIMLY